MGRRDRAVRKRQHLANKRGPLGCNSGCDYRASAYTPELCRCRAPHNTSRGSGGCCSGRGRGGSAPGLCTRLRTGRECLRADLLSLSVGDCLGWQAAPKWYPYLALVSLFGSRDGVSQRSASVGFSGASRSLFNDIIAITGRFCPCQSTDDEHARFRLAAHGADRHRANSAVPADGSTSKSVP